MKKNYTAFRGFNILVIASALTFALSGCSGDDGSQGPPGPPGPPGATVGVASPADATALTMTITGATISSPPVVNFTVTNQNGVPIAGLTDADLRFNIAKLTPGTNGDPSRWQNYINRASSGAVQGSQERFRAQKDYPWGKLIDNKNGTYTYTFCTDITNSTGTPDFTKCPTAAQPNACPAPCTDAEGKALDISYRSDLTTRIGIQMSNSAYPKVNATFNFVPDGRAVSTQRDIVQTANCNECHNQLIAHGTRITATRIETKLCVTCHNPGSWVAGTAGTTPNTSVDFKVFIHKLHYGDDLPSVVAGTPYKIGNTDFSTVHFPQDIRNCTKCHTNTDTNVARNTPQGNNWQTQPSIAACGSCHDDVYFGAAPDPLKPYQTVAHPGGVVTDNSECLTCHAENRIAGSIAEKHSLPALLKAEGAKYKFNIVNIANVTPGGATPIEVEFSVTNPSAPGTFYNIKTDPAFACVPGTGAGTGLPASLSVLVGWSNTDENNSGSGSHPGQPYTASVLDSYASATGTCTNNANVVATGSGTFKVTLAGKTIPAAATGSGRAALYGRVGVDVDGNGVKDRVRVTAAFKDFALTDMTPVPRRLVVDIAKCDKCHDQLSLHGDSRTDQPGLCVMCHNPSATDVNRRPKTAGVPDATLTLDGKKEEAIDFKRLIHGVHGSVIREKGLVVYGFSAAVDFSHVRFPGILNDCSTCHLPGTFELTGKWQVPTQSGVLGSSIDTAPNAVDAATFTSGLADQTDDLNITPTASVCSSCHDGAVAKSHMTLNGALFSSTQATINTGATLEACAICHGPGRLADVKVIHGAK